MNKKIGFIGVGNMGRAILQGILSSEVSKPENIVIYDTYQPIVRKLQDELGVQTVESPEKLAEVVDVVILAVKPNMIESTLTNIKRQLSNDKILISIAAGITIKTIETIINLNCKIVRVMPNTPALVNAGMSAISFNPFVTKDEQQEMLLIFESFGLVEIVPEKLMDAVVGVSGSAPAYVYLFIEALADGAVLEGLSRAQAYQFAAQTVYGAAKMVLETGTHPGVLKDMVCSPGGTTIEAVRVLEKGNFRGTVIDSVVSAAKKNQELAKKD